MYLWHLAKMIRTKAVVWDTHVILLWSWAIYISFPQMYIRVEKFVKSSENCSLSSPPIWLTQKSKSGKDIGLVCVLGG